MSIPIQTDNSVQLSYSSFPFTITNVDNYATSNFVLSLSLNNSNYTTQTSNVLRGLINTKQDTLTAETNILGIGSSISALDYAKITLNKPTNFQADWNTTISNKPIIYTQTETNTLLNAKQNTLTASTILSGIGSNLTLINYSNLFNLPSTFTPTMTNLYNKTEIDSITNNNINYTTITSNILNTKIDVNNINISNILYNTNYTDERQYPPKLYNSASGETSTTEIFNKTTYKQTLTLNTSDITYGFGEYTIYSSSIWGTNTFKQFLFDYNTTNDNPHWLLNNYTTSTGLYSGVSTNFIINDYIGDWIIIKLPNPIILTKFNFYARLTNDLIVRAPSLWRCYGSNDGITFTEITEASNTNALTTNSYTNGLYTKSFNNLISYIYIGFVFSKIIGGDALASTLNFSELQLFGKEQLILPVYISSNVFNSTLTNYSTTGNDTNYLLKTGGILTNNLDISYANPILTIKGTQQNQTAILYLSTPFNGTGALKTAIIAEGNTGWSRAKLHFCLNNTPTGAVGSTNWNEFPTYNATIADARMTIIPDGNVGIGTHTPVTRLHIEHSSTTFNAASGGLYLFNPNNTANSSSCLGARIGGPLANRAGVSLDVLGQYGWSMYINGNDATNRRLIFNSSWDGGGSDRLTIRGNDGNVGISTNNPDCRLSLGSSIGFKVLSLWDNGQTNNFQFVGFGNNGGLCFNTNTNTDAFQFRVGVNSTSATELMRLSGTGNLSIGTTDTATFKLNVAGSIKTTDLVLYNSTTSAYQLLVSGPSSTGPAIIQTVQQGVNFNQNIVFQNSGGNVGIGTTANITEKLFVNGNVKATNLIASTRITAEGDVRSPNFTAYNSAATNYEIYMTAPSATLPATIQTIQQGANFNQSLTIQATGTGTVSIGTTSVGTYKLNVNGSLNATTIWQNGTELNTLLNAKQNTLTFNSPLTISGNTVSFNESAITTLTNFYNKTTSDGIYVKIQSDTFVKKSGDTITGSLIVDNVIYGNNGINIVGNYVGSINVAKRATFAFVPLVNLSRRQYVIPLTYINGNGSGYGTQYIFRVHVWTSTGDFGASGNDVETMSYFVFLSPYDGMKIRIETIYNNSNGSLIQSHTATSLLYNGAPTTGGASEKYCVIENISGY